MTKILRQRFLDTSRTISNSNDIEALRYSKQIAEYQKQLELSPDGFVDKDLYVLDDLDVISIQIGFAIFNNNLNVRSVLAKSFCAYHVYEGDSDNWANSITMGGNWVNRNFDLLHYYLGGYAPKYAGCSIIRKQNKMILVEVPALSSYFYDMYGSRISSISDIGLGNSLVGVRHITSYNGRLKYHKCPRVPLSMMRIWSVDKTNKEAAILHEGDEFEQLYNEAETERNISQVKCNWEQTKL
jgi:hypothetical protein